MALYTIKATRKLNYKSKCLTSTASLNCHIFNGLKLRVSVQFFRALNNITTSIKQALNNNNNNNSTENKNMK